MTGLTDDPVEELMAECLELDEDARPARLAELCSAYPELATELRERFELLLDMGIEVTRVSQAADQFPDRLGGFRLLERLGGGGMGVVFRAEEEALGREVALKLIRPEHLYFPKSRARFRREIEAVARLSHPGIVPVYSVGEEAGIPYFTMELVRGATLADVLHRLAGRAPESLTGEDLVRVVDPDGANALASRDGSPYGGGWIEACLHVVKCVAEALAYAHAQDILHRDIKPPNIALSRDGRPMLLDFGLTSSSDEERATRTGTQLGTLPYMSPEQVRGSSDIDARTDVYSLGVTLYELLALQVPYRGDNRILTEALILAARPDPLRSRNRRVSSEVEVACLKAMDPDRARRYAAIADFARDIGNLLAHRPIEARPAGAWLRAKRWAQRNPARATALVLGLAMLAGVPSALFVLQRAHAKDLEASLERANIETTTADAVLNFVTSLLLEASPERSQGKQVTVLELLGRANDKITPDEFKDQPLVRARLLAHLGQVDVEVGLYQSGLKLLQEASRIYRSQPAANPTEVARALSAEAEALRIMGDSAGASALAQEAHERWSELDGEQSLAAAVTLGNLGNTQYAEGKVDEAETTLREAIRQMEELGPAAEESMSVLLGNLANVVIRKRSLDEAQDLSRQSLEIEERLHEEPHPRIAVAQNSLALTLKLSGRIDEAQELYEKSIGQWRELDPDGSEQLALGLSNVGALYWERGDFERGEETLRESLDIARRVFPGDHPTIERLLDINCNMLCKRKRFRQAAPLLDELMPMRVRLHGDEVLNLRPAAEFASMALKGEYPDETPLSIADRLVAKIWPGLPETDAHQVFALLAVANAMEKSGEAEFAVEARRLAAEIHARDPSPATDQR